MENLFNVAASDPSILFGHQTSGRCGVMNVACEVSRRSWSRAPRTCRISRGVGSWLVPMHRRQYPLREDRRSRASGASRLSLSHWDGWARVSASSKRGNRAGTSTARIP